MSEVTDPAGSTFEVLRGMELFAGLDDAELADASARGTEQAVSADELIIQQGEQSDALYIVLAGDVSISKTVDGHRVELCVNGRGEYFGEMALFDRAPRSATVQALTAGRLLRLSRVACLQLFERSPSLLHALALRFNQALRSSTQQRVGLEQQNQALRIEAELERLRALSQMVVGLAHELNTPLGIMQNAASLVVEILAPTTVSALARDSDAAEALADAAAACALIQKNVNHTAGLVRAFKNLSVRQISEARERVDLQTLIVEALELHRLKSRAARLDVRVACELDEQQRAWEGFPGQLSQVVLNLISNIERYAYPDGQGGRVEVSLRRESNAVFELMVRDHGRGIKAEHRARIFEPFFTTGRDREGTGLGLAIVHNIVSGALGGSIRVESEIDRGTTFFLRFPMRAPEGGQP